MARLMHQENPQYIEKLIHELNQSMTAIKAYVGGCELRLEKKGLSAEQMLNALQKINQHVELLKNKIYSLQEPTTQKKLGERPAIFHDIITEIISLYSYEIEHNNIRLVVNFQDECPDFHIPQLQLKHILFRLLKQCITVVEKNKIHKATLEIQTDMDKNTAKIMIKSNFLIQEEEFEKELTYCRTLLDRESGTLFAELFANSISFQLIVFHQEYKGYAF